MHVNGIGLIFAGGLGVERFSDAINSPWKPPQRLDDGGRRMAYLVDVGQAGDKSLMRKLRRADKLSRMAVIAAADALRSAGYGPKAPDETALLIATGLGPHVTTFGFLEEILKYGDAGVSPTAFSNSVHNAAASYVSETLGVQCTTLTVTQFYHSFEQALLIAGLWLREKRCKRALVGAVEQYGDVLGYVCDNKLTQAPDGMIRPFSLNPAHHVLGEGSVFFLLEGEPGKNTFCRIGKVRRLAEGEHAGEGKRTADLVVIASDGLLPYESAYAECPAPGVPVAAYSPAFGSMMVGSAFNTAAAAMMLKDGTLLPGPVLENPHGLNVLSNPLPVQSGKVCCVRSACEKEMMLVSLEGD